jgi:predicted lipoprotein with Yx(FWY)xxD motif
MKKILVTLFALFAFTVSAYAGSAPAKASNGILVDSAKGMTLYTFDKDTVSGKSVCNGDCAAKWPPYIAPSAKKSGKYTVITRDDGKLQWAYKGKPLYFWVKDEKPGDKSGDNVNNVWHVIQAAAAK